MQRDRQSENSDMMAEAMKEAKFAHIKEKLDLNHWDNWHCMVGKNLNYQAKQYTLFHKEQLAILPTKSADQATQLFKILARSSFFRPSPPIVAALLKPGFFFNASAPITTGSSGRWQFLLRLKPWLSSISGMSFSRMPLVLAFSESSRNLAFRSSYFLRSATFLSLASLASFRKASMVFLSADISQSFSLMMSGCSLAFCLILRSSRFCMSSMSKKMLRISGRGVFLISSYSRYLTISEECYADSFLYLFMAQRSFSSFFSFYSWMRRLISVRSFQLSSWLKPFQSASFFTNSFLTFSSSTFSRFSSCRRTYSSALLAFSSLQSQLMELRSFSLISEVFLISLRRSSSCFFSEWARVVSMALSCSLAALLRVRGKCMGRTSFSQARFWQLGQAALQSKF